MDSEYQRFTDEAKEYVRLRYDMLRLELLEKMSKIVALIVVLLIVIVLALTALTYFSLAAVYALKDVLGSTASGFCIFGGLFVLLALIVLMLRKQIILNPLIKQLSGILFKQDDDYEEDDTSNKEEK